MAWIQTIHEDDASGELRDIYERISGARGKLSNIMRVQSLRPEAMMAHLDLYMALLFGKSGLRRAERELIATVVSVANDCEYCTRHHAEALLAYWKDPLRVEQVIADPRLADLSEREQALVDYALKLTRQPGAVSEEDVNGLREQGLADRDVLDANMITGYFNFVNRVAEGLGVEVTDEEVGGYDY
jgi:uncharacterized peroxidase-related enzyme